MVSSKLRFYLSFIFIFFLGCASSEKFQYGFYTKMTHGSVQLENPDEGSDVLLLVVQLNKTFIETSQGYLEEPEGKVFNLNSSGNFRVQLPFVAHQHRIYFLSRNHKMHSIETRRSLGVGAEEYHISLSYDPNWKNNFAFYIRPFVVGFLEKYKRTLNPKDLGFLYAWLSKNEIKTLQPEEL